MRPALEPALGLRLRELRESRGLPRAATERLAGVGAGTIKAWETGSRTPRGPALVRLLDALEASDRQRAELIALADPAHARLALADHPAGPPLELGAVLRAFRLRRGWTQTEAARALDVTQGAVAHWESGLRSLEGPSLHQALFALGANAEEVAAALASPHRPEAVQEDPHLVRNSIQQIPGVLREPFLLANERDLWWRAAREPGWEVPLLEAMVQRGTWYVFMRRFDEVVALGRRIRAMAPDIRKNGRPSGLAIVFADVRYRPHASPSGLARRLDGLQSELNETEFRAWAQGSQAVGLAAMGERRSVAIARQALEESLRTANPMIESQNRTVDLAEVHLRLGEPDRALEALGDGPDGVDRLLWQGGRNPQGLAVRARATIALGREPDPDLLAAIRSFTATDGTPYYQDRLASVERELDAMRRG